MFSPGTPFADRFRIDAEVGRGTFGVVYRAYDFPESREVALKILHPEANADATLKHRLRREARLTTEMKSPHCVRVFDVGETAEGRAYIVMELLEGRELHAALSGGEPFPPERVIAVARQILEAVGEAHALGVIHRDLKPSNIFLCRTPEGADFVKILDFGIAKITGTPDGTGLSESARLTTHGNVLGTPVYMSPEQCRGEIPTPASDLYSIGVMLFELLSGKPPFDDPNPVHVLMKHNSDEVPSLPAAVAATPLGVAVKRVLEKSPERRYHTAQEFSEALTSFAVMPSAMSTTPAVAPATTTAASPQAASPPSRGNQATGQFKALDLPQAASPSPAPESQRSPLPIVVTIVVLLLLAAAAAVVMWPKS